VVAFIFSRTSDMAWVVLTVPLVEEPPSGIFGVPLGVSIKYANVAISLTNEQGESFIYGYVPIVVAKCGVFLKEKGES
jgi:GTPase-activating protein SAC7